MNDPVEWVAPIPGHWRQDFRLAEWLPGPVSRSCETWLLPALDRGFSEVSLDEYGGGTKTGVAVVNGWAYCTDPMPTKPLGLIRHAPVRMARVASAMARMFEKPEAVERWVATPGHERYRSTDLPALTAAVGNAERRIPQASPTELVEIVDGLAVATGRLMLGMVQTMGFGGKVEYAMARFFADHLADRVHCGPLDLAVGHTTPRATPHPERCAPAHDTDGPTARPRK